MIRPTWVTILGVLMLMFGGCGAFNDIKLIKTPVLMHVQQSLLSDFEKNMPEDFQDSLDITVFEDFVDTTEVSLDSTFSKANIADTFKQITHISDEGLKVIVKHGWVGLIISLFYILSGLLIFFKKEIALPTIIAALVISLLFAIYQIYDMREADISMILKAGLKLLLYFGVFLDIILLVLIGTCDRSYFKEQDLQEDYYDNVQL